MKRIALVLWTALVVAVTVLAAVKSGKILTRDEVVAAGVFLAAIALAVLERRNQKLRNMLQQPLPREVTFVVLAILGFLLLVPLVRVD